MMGAQHTPGPWKKAAHGPIDVFDAKDRDVVTVYGGGVPEEQREANARLISAAPDLLAAAKRALNFIENTEGEIGERLSSGDLLRAAVAKAEGRS